MNKYLIALSTSARGPDVTLIGNGDELLKLLLAEVVQVRLQVSQLRHAAAAPWSMARRVFAPACVHADDITEFRWTILLNFG